MTLVGLFPLHRGPDCSEMVKSSNYRGFQRMEAMVRAIKEVNERTDYSSVYVEAIIYDTCSDFTGEYVIYIIFSADLSMFISSPY